MKTIGGQGKKQAEAVEVLKPITQKLRIKDAIPENTLSEEAKNELNKIKDIEKWWTEKNYIKQINMHITFQFLEQ